jgi:tRNA modification GTPase
VAGRLQALREALARLQGQARQGALLREGLDVVIAGVPNAGKSSLLNALAGQDLAIVTDVPGTTRDRIRQTLSIDGVPLHVVDTAGLRATTDPVERLGVERSWQAIADADLVLWLHDLSRADDPAVIAEEQRIAGELARLRGAAAAGAVLHAFNKADAVDASTARRAVATVPPIDDRTLGAPGADDALCVSVRTGAGLDRLRAALLARAGWQAPREGVFLARTRHLQALARAATRVDEAAAQLALASPALDLLAEDLRGAHHAIGEITGEFSTEDLLGAIFGRFCIGK